MYIYIWFKAFGVGFAAAPFRLPPLPPPPLPGGTGLVGWVGSVLGGQGVTCCEAPQARSNMWRPAPPSAPWWLGGLSLAVRYN